LSQTEEGSNFENGSSFEEELSQPEKIRIKKQKIRNKARWDMHLQGN
jgi:hypothetical protein